MSANSSMDQEASAAPASDGLDLNADVAVVGNNQVSDAVEAAPGSEPEILTEPWSSVGSVGQSLEEGVDLGGTEGRDEGKAETDVRELGSTEMTAKQEGFPDPSMESEVVVCGSNDGDVGTAEGGAGHAEGQCKGGVTADFIEGNEHKECPSLELNQTAGSEVLPGSAEAGDGSLHKGDRGGGQLDISGEHEVAPAVEAQDMNPQPVDKNPVDKGDVVMVVPVVGAQGEDTPAVDENPPSKGDAVMFVPVTEEQSEDTDPVEESPGGKGDVLMEESDSVAVVSLQLPSQQSEDKGVGSQALPCVGEYDSSSGLILDVDQNNVAPSEDTHLVDERHTGKADVVMCDLNSVALVSVSLASQPSEDQNFGSQALASEGEVSAGNQNTEAQSEDAHLGDGKQTGEGDVVRGDSSSVAGENNSFQVEVSAGLLVCENQNTETQSVGSLPAGDNQSSEAHDVEAPASLQSALVDLDTLPSGGEKDIGSEPVKDEISLPEESHGKVGLDKKPGVNGEIPVPRDGMENDVAEVGTDGNQKVEIKALESSNTAENPAVKFVAMKPSTPPVEIDHRVSYYLTQEEKAELSISDLVWGKVKSHPWWPGQIFDPSDASDLALKHQRKDNFLVAYFGDKTFAWCEESHLKPFKTFFSQMEKQSSSDAFVNAVNGALGEISRRVELGMMCSCVPEEDNANLKNQRIENAGIQEGASSVLSDKSLGVASFLPDRLLEYVKVLACSPSEGADRLELMIAQAQLLAFYRSKGYTELPVFVVGRGLENDADISHSKRKRLGKDLEVLSDSLGKGKPKGGGSLLHKQMHILEDSRKQKSLSELMEDKNDSHLVNGDRSGSEVKVAGKAVSGSSGRKRKGIDFDSADSGKGKKKRLDSLGDLENKSPLTINRSFNVGERISRAASQLTGSPPPLKCNGETFQKRGSSSGVDASPYTPEEPSRIKKGILKDYSSPSEMLSQLCLAARDPMKGYSFLSIIISFFTNMRDSSTAAGLPLEKVRGRRGRKKSSDSKAYTSETSTPLEKIRRKRGRKKLSDSKADLSETSTPLKKIGRKRGRKKSSDSKADLLETSTPLEKVGRKRGRKKSSDSKADSSETSTPDYMQDSYWTDRVVQSSPGRKPLSRGRKRKGEPHMQSPTKKSKNSMDDITLSHMLETAQHLRVSAVSPSKNRDLSAEKQINFFGEKCVDESSPTALILSFNESDSLPSETVLIRIFSRYGPLKEADTEVLKKANRAKVVFKRRADAEVAFSSAGKYSIFGPALVSYRLKYSSSAPETSPQATPDGKNDATPMDAGNAEVPAQVETKE